MKKSSLIAPVFLFLFPLLVFAQDLQQVLETIMDLFSLLIPLVIALALFYFFWGLANFIRKSGDSTAQEEGRNQMVWGIIALFVMLSIWGIVTVLQETLGLRTLGAPPVEHLIPGGGDSGSTPGSGSNEGTNPGRNRPPGGGGSLPGIRI
tara:strand:- start:11 stop:460 length:450 start_codon:yes stop_codon:yes gene_type:complete